MKKMVNKLILIIKYGANIVLTIPSRILFGTVTRFWNTCLIPSVILHFKNPQYKKVVSDLSLQGFTKVKTNLSGEFWDRLQLIFIGSINSEDKSYLTNNRKTRRINNPLITLGHDSIASILEDKNIVNILRSYYGIDYKLKEVNAWRNFPANPKDYVYSNFWHMDDYSITSLRIFCYLSKNIDEESGATRIVTLSDSKKAVRSFKFIHTSINGIAEKFSDIKFNYLNGTLGDVFIFSADRCLHAATAISSSRPRDMLELVIDFR